MITRSLGSLLAALGAIAVATIVVPAGAEPLPQPLAKTGSCPSGYSVSGAYCTPGSGARFAVRKIGNCPSGYSTSGDYCLAGKGRSTCCAQGRNVSIGLLHER